MIDSPFWEDPIFGANNDRIDKALAHTYLPYDSGSIFKLLEPLELDFQEKDLVETSPSPFTFSIVHYLGSSSSDILTPCHMISSNHEPKYSVNEEPLIDYTLPPQTHPQDFDHSMTSPLQCDHHLEKPICCTPSFPNPFFPSHQNLVVSTKHNIIDIDCDKDFLRVIIHSTIVYLEGKLGTSILTYFHSPKTSLYLGLRSYFPASHLLDPPCNCPHSIWELLHE